MRRVDDIFGFPLIYLTSFLVRACCFCFRDTVSINVGPGRRGRDRKTRRRPERIQMAAWKKQTSTPNDNALEAHSLPRPKRLRHEWRRLYSISFIQWEPTTLFFIRTHGKRGCSAKMGWVSSQPIDFWQRCTFPCHNLELAISCLSQNKRLPKHSGLECMRFMNLGTKKWHLRAQICVSDIGTPFVFHTNKNR